MHSPSAVLVLELDEFNSMNIEVMVCTANWGRSSEARQCDKTARD